MGHDDTDKRLKHALWVVLIIGVAIEVIVRPFWPDIVIGESALGQIVHVLLALVGAGGM